MFPITVMFPIIVMFPITTDTTRSIAILLIISTLKIIVVEEAVIE